MKPKYLTLKQLTNIIENDFVGKHDRYGRKVDYHDYKDEILKRYWELKDREFRKETDKIEAALDSLPKLQGIQANEIFFDDAPMSLDPLTHSKIFNRFKYLAQCIEINSY